MNYLKSGWIQIIPVICINSTPLVLCALQSEVHKLLDVLCSILHCRRLSCCNNSYLISCQTLGQDSDGKKEAFQNG